MKRWKWNFILNVIKIVEAELFAEYFSTAFRDVIKLILSFGCQAIPESPCSYVIIVDEATVSLVMKYLLLTAYLLLSWNKSLLVSVIPYNFFLCHLSEVSRFLPVKDSNSLSIAEDANFICNFQL